jgi:Protein of unknown function (DUF3383)
MSALSQVVSISISSATKAAAATSFNEVLIAGYTAAFLDRTKRYSELADLVADGITSSNPIYLAAAALYAQPNHPDTFKVGRFTTQFTMSYKFTPTAQNSKVYTVKVNGLSATYTSDASATVAEICTGLQLAITALAISGVSATDNTTYFTVQGTAGTYFTIQSTGDGVLTIEDTTADPGVTTELNAILAEDQDFYGLVCTQHSAAIVEAVSAVAQTNKKFYGASTLDTAVTTSSTTDVAYTIKALSADHTFLIYNQAPHTFPEAAAFGQLFPYDPGAANYAFKNLVGIAATPLTGAQLGYLEAKCCNYYETIGGNSVLLFGRVSSAGQYADTVTGIDWLGVRTQERLFTLQLNNAKIAFTDAGIAQVEKEIRAQILEGIGTGFINGDKSTWSVTVPLAKNVSTANKVARKLPVTFQCQAAGAVNVIDITGIVTA